ncbi:glycosyltransferase [Seonamhaeicola aphaedonensis]|uniref:N-acetylgalactosamine-N, N'-diacetylbacillosaminyl-diphospho-undecaprenol 4-alpha-N-acetylgalactosaminyltransferase n=1 Tax=Seonamhaeicola aphaedonensis TaxID=1461338 RepID=A0A3D9HG25_9FLAO|nr:glycosyltransferase [Seonamhaeicola aphaedonensis]RED48452.1 N-acetylgalactosamine-N,N'-diacetylbacillosaminyl-diphospho-undecaprenol 4-alpha-N-acetylgalactosaminyltransferase [Seonamhaeicola aphaedonensis]
MVQNFRRKVCLIVDCLSGGGAERIAALLSIKLTDLNYDVSIISIRNEISYEFNGILYNLGINEPKFKILKQVSKFFDFKKVYKDINADVYIDFRMRNRVLMEWLFHVFVFDVKKMIMAIHSYNIFYHMPKHKFFYKEYNSSVAIVGVSKHICKCLEQVYEFKNLVNISNFYSRDILNMKYSDGYVDIDKEFVLAVGRLDNEIKQFDKLILAYKNSILINKSISLIIIGEGKDRPVLENLILRNNLEDYVKLLGFKDNVYSYMKAAKFLLLSSKVEGFPNVILESLVFGTPVISFNCKSGPSEMIQNGVNGILVEDQNFEAFTQAMNKMISDKGYYENCKSNTLSSVKKFSEKNVMDKWINLIES